MNAVSDKARSAAMQFEGKKNSLTQVQSGDWKLQFTVSAVDVPAGLLTAPMGTRYVVAIVEVSDDEQPVEQKPAGNKHRLSRQAAMLCSDRQFWGFLRNEFSGNWMNPNFPQPTDNQLRAAECIRSICNVKSRSEFDSEPADRRWRELKASFEAWKLTA